MDLKNYVNSDKFIINLYFIYEVAYGLFKYSRK